MACDVVSTGWQFPRHLVVPMTEIEILKKKLNEAEAEIQTLRMRLRNAEILYGHEKRRSDALKTNNNAENN